MLGVCLVKIIKLIDPKETKADRQIHELAKILKWRYRPFYDIEGNRLTFLKPDVHNKITVITI